MIRRITLAALIGLVSQAAFGQSPPAPLAFEVVSIKPSQSGGPRSGVRAQAGNLTGKNVTLKQLMAYANDIPGYLLWGPDWIETDGYDVAAMAKNSPSATELRLMLRTLLEDRFKLKTHRETKEIPAYWLVLAKGGPKLRDPKEPEVGPICCSSCSRLSYCVADGLNIFTKRADGFILHGARTPTREPNNAKTRNTRN
jgi:hypothetical protein